MGSDYNLALSDVTKCFLSLSSERQEVEGYYTPAGNFNAADDFPSHIQGIAKCSESPRFFLTTSAQGGLLIPGLVVKDGYVLQERKEVRPNFNDPDPREQPGDLHPGGIQTIGEHVVVPIYSSKDEARFEIQTWTYDEAAKTMKCCATLVKQIPEEKPSAASRKNLASAYCIGITNVGNEYILAVGVERRGSYLHIYRGESVLREFSYIDTVRTRRRHPNSIALIADTEGSVFLLGMRCGPFRWFGRVGEWLRELTGIGQDKIDLYKLYADGRLTKPDPEGWLRRLEKPLHVKCRRGWEQPSFRWGGNACAVSDSKIEVIAVGLQIYRAKDGQPDHECKFEVDRFGTDEQEAAELE